MALALSLQIYRPLHILLKPWLHLWTTLMASRTNSYFVVTIRIKSYNEELCKLHIYFNKYIKLKVYDGVTVVTKESFIIRIWFWRTPWLWRKNWNVTIYKLTFDLVCSLKFKNKKNTDRKCNVWVASRKLKSCPRRFVSDLCRAFVLIGTAWRWWRHTWWFLKHWDIHFIM